MNKFKVGDKVVYVNQLCKYAPDDIELGQCYTVDGLLGDRCITLGGIGGMFPAWQEERFELFSEWASHQVPVSTETELSLTKLQVKMLQDWKNENIKKVERYDWLRSAGKEQQNVIAHYGYEDMDKIIDKLMLLENPNE